MSGEVLRLPAAPVIEATIVGTDTTELSGVIQTESQPNIIVLEANLTNLTDVTVANATASKHGLLPKLSNIGTDVLRGDGTWGAPAGGSLSSLLLPGPTNPADLLDIGFLGRYVSSGTKYTGLFRDATDGRYKLYQGLTVAPSTDVVDLTSGVLSELLVGSLTTNGSASVGTPAVSSCLTAYEATLNTCSNTGITVRQNSTGDALVQYNARGSRITTGIDSSDSYKYKIGRGPTVDANTIVSIDPRYQNSVTLVSTWTDTSIPEFNQWRSVCWSPELRLFCAVAAVNDADPQVMTSPNAVSWTSRTAASVSAWTSVCWSSELRIFCAVASEGTGNRVMTSVNGTAWTSRTSAADNNWSSVCWSRDLNLFVAVATSGTGNRVMTSPDGIAWTIRTSAADNSWKSVCWAPELRLFCAVSSDGASNRVMTSPNGITWTIRTTPANNVLWNSVCWAPELLLFCAVGTSPSTGGDGVMTSTNGINWTIGTLVPGTYTGFTLPEVWYSVCWSSEARIFVALPDEFANNLVYTSPDGITWTGRSSYVNVPYFAICWAPELGIFVAVGNEPSSGCMYTGSLYVNTPNVTIAGIRGKTTGVADAINVVIDSTGQLGTTSSSITKKHNIRDMSDFTDRLYLLDPVIFKWKPDHCIDQTDQYGLIAERVAEVFPELAVKDPNDVNYLTVAYQNLVPMLLNELKKLKAKSTEHTELISSLRTELDVLKNKP